MTRLSWTRYLPDLNLSRASSVDSGIDAFVDAESDFDAAATSGTPANGRSSAAPDAPEDIFVDERRQLQTQAETLFAEATVLRQQLTSLTDREQGRGACGLPPAFDANDAALAWLQSLPACIFRLPDAGTDLEKAVARAGAKFGSSVVSLGAGMCDVIMRLRTANFAPRQLRALGLRQGGMLTLTVHCDPAYHRAAEPPALTMEYAVPGQPPQVATSAVADAKHHFRVGYQMLNILTRQLNAAWRGGATESVLDDLLALAAKRMENLPQHCVVCDQSVKLQQLRPGTCGGADCISQAETWGYGFEPQDIVQNPEVADLLISLTRAAAVGGKEAFFTRVPSVFHRTAAIDFAALTQDIDTLPSVDSLVKSADMITALEAASPTAVATLSWLVSSNEGYLEYIPKHQQYAAMNTPWQFRIFGGPVERELAFQARPGQHKNRFAFHGSGFANWHSILRTGLVVGGTNKAFDYHGAAYGAGIYVSNNASTSMSYSRGAIEGWRNSRLGGSPACLALCETNGPARGPHLGTELGDVEVFANADAVALRYLFVYPAANYPTVTASAAARHLRTHADKDNSVYVKRRGLKFW